MIEDMTYEDFCNILDGTYDFDKLLGEEDLQKLYAVKEYDLLRRQVNLYLAESVDLPPTIRIVIGELIKNNRIKAKRPRHIVDEFESVVEYIELRRAGVKKTKAIDKVAEIYGKEESSIRDRLKKFDWLLSDINKKFYINL